MGPTTSGEVFAYNVGGVLWGTHPDALSKLRSSSNDGSLAPNSYVLDTLNKRVRVSNRLGTTYWGTEGTGEGQFSNPTGLAIMNRRVYVVDSNTRRVQIFTAGGTFLAGWDVGP